MRTINHNRNAPAYEAVDTLNHMNSTPEIAQLFRVAEGIDQMLSIKMHSLTGLSAWQ